MSKEKWTFSEWSSAIADTGDYDGGVNLTNGKDVWHTSGEDLEDKDLKKFCSLLDLMPDLWSERTDHAEFMLSQLQKKSDEFEKALIKIKSMCDGNVTNENNIWHICNKTINEASF